MKNDRRIFFVLFLVFVLTLSGCMPSGNTDEGPEIFAEVIKPGVPDKLKTNKDGIPVLKVYDVNTKEILEMDIETYLEGVLAGEMKNDWPLDALKAQAILARTFVLNFVSEKSSKYEGADISTDIKEAQAYAPDAIDDTIRRAVRETTGLVMSYDGEFPQAWFHAHSGGMTELPTVALAYKQGDPEYLRPVESADKEVGPANVRKWTCSFSLEDAEKACRETGVSTGPIRTFAIESKGVSGRTKTFSVNGYSVSAPEFRIQIGANVLKSTLIDEVKVENGKVFFTGSGYGHGVGMSQWGAKQMAEEGMDASRIVRHYFSGVDIVRIYGMEEK